MALLLSLALSVLVLQYLARLSADERNTRATMAYVLDVMACVAQQGVPNVSRLVPTRVAVIVLLVANLVLYNYYTSTVVSGLLTSCEAGKSLSHNCAGNARRLLICSLKPSELAYNRLPHRYIAAVNRCVWCARW